MLSEKYKEWMRQHQTVKCEKCHYIWNFSVNPNWCPQCQNEDFTAVIYVDGKWVNALDGEPK